MSILGLAPAIEVPVATCPKCGSRLDAASGIKNSPAGPVTPKPGDWCMCVRCGAVLRFNRLLQFELPTGEAVIELAETQYDGLLHILAARKALKDMHAAKSGVSQPSPEGRGRPIHHTKPFGIYHWDTFEDRTMLIGEADTRAEAEALVKDRYKDSLAKDGADQIDVVDAAGDVVRSFKIR